MLWTPPNTLTVQPRHCPKLWWPEARNTVQQQLTLFLSLRLTFSLQQSLLSVYWKLKSNHKLVKDTGLPNQPLDDKQGNWYFLLHSIVQQVLFKMDINLNTHSNFTLHCFAWRLLKAIKKNSELSSWKTMKT